MAGSNASGVPAADVPVVDILSAAFSGSSLRIAMPRTSALPSSQEISAPSAFRQSIVARMSCDSSIFRITLVPSAIAAQMRSLCAMLLEGGAVILPCAAEGCIVAIISASASLFEALSGQPEYSGSMTR